MPRNKPISSQVIYSPFVQKIGQNRGILGRVDINIGVALYYATSSSRGDGAGGASGGGGLKVESGQVSKCSAEIIVIL